MFMKGKTLKNATFVRIDLVFLNSHNSNVHERKSSYKSRETKKQNDNLIIVYQILGEEIHLKVGFK